VSEINFPLGLSVAGHAVCLALLILLLPTKIPPVPEPLATGGLEVVFAPLPKPEEPQPPVQAEIPPPQAETPPPEPEPMPPPPDEPVAAIEPPPPAPETPAPVVQPPPPLKPTVKPPPRPIRHHLEQAAPNPTPAPSQPTQAAVATPQTAYAPTPVPAPVPSNEVSPGYRALLSAWLESHKRYPDSARQRGEEGRAILRFAVDRSGRVLDFAVAQSSGFRDIDASIEEMMRSATLPPFPAGMAQQRIDVSVTIRFSLAR
jgi:periplasmic protein TonB